MLDDQYRVREAMFDAKQRVYDTLGDIWWWLLIRGVLALCLGFFAIFWPQKTVSILVNLLGAFLLFDGVVGAVRAVRAGGRLGFPTHALLSLVIGFLLLFWTGNSIRVFLTLVGVWALLQGTSLYWASRGVKNSEVETRGMFGSVGIALAVIGLILIMWPTMGVVAISWLVATIALIIGFVLVFLATRLRRLSDRMNSRLDS